MHVTSGVYVMTVKPYILEKLDGEIERLGYQHSIWSSKVHEQWRKAGIGAGAHVLDAGCGPGFATLELSEIVGDKGKVFALDRTANYLAYLRAEIRAKYGSEKQSNITVAEGFLDKIPFADNSVDFIFIKWVLLFVPELQPVIDEFQRILKRGGKLLVVDYHDFYLGSLVPRSAIVEEHIKCMEQYLLGGVNNTCVGRVLPDMLHGLGFRLDDVIFDLKVGHPNDKVWRWIEMFYRSATSTMLKEGALQQQTADLVWQEIARLLSMPNVCFISAHFALITATLS